MQYYVRYFTLYQNSPSRFGGPFASREEAVRATECSLPEVVWPGQHPQNVKTAWRAMVLPAHEIRTGEFRQFVRDWYLAQHNDPNPDRFAPLPFDPQAVESRRLRELIEKALP